MTIQTISELKKFADDFAKALDSVLEGVALDAVDAVADCMARYNEMIPGLDERSRFCASLLEKGLRHEALGYEAEEPALLEAVTLLDLAGRPQWQRWLEKLKSLGFPEPQMPKMEVAQELRDAQEQVVRLKPLLDQWRRFNLMNAPLPTRIAMLRQLRKHDPNNEAWHESLKLHEKQRAMQIEADVKEAVAARDEQRLSALAEEFKAEWLEPPAQRIVKAVETALESIRGSRLDGEIVQVSDGLEAALEARDLEAGRSLRDRWNDLIAAKGAFDAADANVLRATPAVEWVERHDRVDVLVTEVWQLLDARPQTREARREWVRKLTRMSDEVEDLAEKLEADIDLEAVERLQARVERAAGELHREESGRRRLALVAVGAATSVILGTVITFVSVMRRREQVQQAVAAVDGQLRKVEAAAADPAELPPPALPEWLAKEPVVAARLAALQEAAGRETERRERFSKEISKTTELLDALAKRKDLASMDPWPEPFVDATKSLTALQQGTLAKTEEDLAAVEKLAGRLQNAANRFQRAADNVFAGRVATIKDRLERLRQAARRSRESVGEQLTEISGQVKELRAIAGEPGAPGAIGAFAEQRRVGRAAAMPLDPDEEIERGIASLRADMSELDRFQAAEKGLGEALGDWKRYASVLEGMAKEFGKQAAVRDYAEAAKEVELWEGLEQWNRFVGQLPPLATLPAEEARNLAANAEQLQEQAGRLKPVADFVAAYMPAMKSFADRNPAEIRESLLKWCDREWLGEVECIVRPNDGQTYYALQKPKPGALSFKYQRGWKDAGEWPDPKVQPLANALTEEMIQDSPQKQLARDLEAKDLATMATASGVGIDELLADMAIRIIDARDVEPCVRMVNLRKILATARQCSLCFQGPKVAALWSKLDDGAGAIPEMTVGDLVEFLDPNRAQNKSYVKVRKFAERVLADAGEAVKPLRDATRAERRRLSEAAPETFVCVGRIGRDLEGGLVVLPAKHATWTKGQEAIVIRPDGNLGVVGACGDPGRIELRSKGPVLAGMPVFVRRESAVKRAPSRRD
jgi:hypothetical protein